MVAKLSEDEVQRTLQALADHGGNATAAAADLGLSPRAVRDRREKLRDDGLYEDSGVLAGLAATGLSVTGGGWVKTHDKDRYGRTYSFRVQRNAAETMSTEQRAEKMSELLSSIPAVKLEAPPASTGSLYMRKAFIPVNDLHAGALAWGKETGYGDWDLDIAVGRLQLWLGRLLLKVQRDKVDEIVIYYNGDTLHTNGEAPFTPASGHVLDKDTRNFKLVDAVTAAIITTTDLAAQAAPRVRLVIKRGNHDEDSHLALLQGAKWRYFEQKNVTVELDPSPYWLHTFGKVMLYGHHGDRVKPEQVIMKMAADHRKEWGEAEHVVLWTAHKHQREMKTFHGAVWEQASCWTDPDSYGAYWGNHAQAQAVIYHEVEGETDRYTVRQIDVS